MTTHRTSVAAVAVVALVLAAAGCAWRPAVSVSDLESLLPPIIATHEFRTGDRAHLERSEVVTSEDIRARFGEPIRVETDTTMGDLVWWYRYADRRGDEVAFTFVYRDIPTCSGTTETGCATQGGFSGWLVTGHGNPEWGP